MTLKTLILSSLLLIPAVVFGGLTSNVLRSGPNSSSGSESLEEYFGGAVKNYSQQVYGDIPSTFDARTQWSHCPSISKLMEAACCQASYAIVPTSVMTDRTCIVSNRTDVVYSAYDPIACCKSCWLLSWKRCLNGYSEEVWKYWQTYGIATESCLPYVFGRECIPETCPAKCIGADNKAVLSDKLKGVYHTLPSTVQDIQREILMNGPVEASFQMHLNFRIFKGKGVYRRSDGPLVAKHSVKIIGWGTQDGIDYWLISNTMGKTWGDEGFGKFLRGHNYLAIESQVHAGFPAGY